MKTNNDTVVYSLIEKKYNHDASGKNTGLDHVSILDIFDCEETAYAYMKTKCIGEFEKNPCRMTYGYFASGVKNDGYYYEYMVMSHLVVPRVTLKTIKIKTEYLDEETLYKVRLFDAHFYTNIALTEEWYKMRYKSHHSIFAVYDNNAIYNDRTSKFVGYVCGVPIAKELYDAISLGIMYDDINVNPNMFLEQSKYVYIPSILLDEKYRNLGIGSMLFEKILEKYNNHFLCGITISKDGFNLANKYMQHKCNVMKDRDVFVLDNTNNFKGE